MDVADQGIDGIAIAKIADNFFQASHHATGFIHGTDPATHPERVTPRQCARFTDELTAPVAKTSSWTCASTRPWRASGC